jgi:hypothetical protein
MIELPTYLGWVPMPWLHGNMHQIVDQLEDVLQSLVLYQAMLFVTISVVSAVICFILLGSIRLSKIIVSGQRMIMMKPSAVVTCLILVACFAGHAGAKPTDRPSESPSDYPSESPSTEYYWGGYPEGLCLQQAVGRNPGCTSNDIEAVVTNYTGPSNCTVGTTIYITSITTSISGHATNRYDFGVYVGIGGISNALTGAACLVQTLKKGDGKHVGGDGDTVEDADDDRCLDYGADGSFKSIDHFEINNFEIECKTGPTSNGKAVISACFSWDNNAGNTGENACPRNCTNTPNTTLHEKCLGMGTNSVSSAASPQRNGFIHFSHDVPPTSNTKIRNVIAVK